MRPSSLGGAAYCVALCLSVCLSVSLSVRPVIVSERHVAPPSELQYTCTFQHALRAAYRTAISAAQILVSDCNRARIVKIIQDIAKIKWHGFFGTQCTNAFIRLRAEDCI